MTLYQFTFEGEYENIPFSDQNAIEKEKSLRFLSREEIVMVPIKKKITLKIRKGTNRKYFFMDENKNPHFFYIENVTLFDPWEELKEMFDSPEYREWMEMENREDYERALEKHLLQKCPRGLYYVMVEYESEDFSLQIYSKDFLQQKVIPCSGNSNSSFFISFQRTSDKKYGRHRLPLRYCCMEYPVSPDTAEVEAEILSASIKRGMPGGKEFV